jgi:hypothetical protein
MISILKKEDINMNQDSTAAMIINDLDSLIHRIEDLPGHPRYTDALVAIQDAKQAVSDGRAEIHRHTMGERFSPKG